MKTYISDNLYSKVFDHFNEYKDHPTIVKNSIPILYFGDLPKYLNESFKIVTVGVNPSKSEFSEKRFPNYRKSHYSYEFSQNEYFTQKPYRKWFNCNDWFLRELGYSYYSNNKTRVIHTDFSSPLATIDQWSMFKKKNKDLANIFFENGFEIWKDLIDEINPDLIIYPSPITSQWMIELSKKLGFKKEFEIGRITIKDNGEPRSFPAVFIFGSIEVKQKKYPLLFVEGSRIVPFGGILRSEINNLNIRDLLLDKTALNI